MLNIDRWKINGDKILWTQSLKKQGQGSLRDRERKSENRALSKVQWQVAGRSSGNGARFCNTVDKISNLNLDQEL